MKSFSRVMYIPNDDAQWHTGRVFIDDHEISSVRALRYEHEAMSMPTVTLELNADYPINEMVKLDVTVPVENSDEAMKCIAFIRQLDKTFEQKLIDRIYSALIDSRNDKCLYEQASAILDYLLEDY